MTGVISRTAVDAARKILQNNSWAALWPQGFEKGAQKYSDRLERHSGLRAPGMGWGRSDTKPEKDHDAHAPLLSFEIKTG